MVQTWLKPNRRAVALGMILPGLAAVLGLLWAVGVLPPESAATRLAGAVVAALGFLLLLLLAREMVRPRIGYRGGEVLFYLLHGGPIRVPLDVVEAFLLGQGASQLPGRRLKAKQTRTVIVRLAEKAEAWAQRDVSPSLGSWCGGYITIRGTWCEPLDVDTVKRLNRLLSQQRRAHQETMRQHTPA